MLCLGHVRPQTADNNGAMMRATYPEYNIESKYEIFDAAAHFVSLEMLSWHHCPYLQNVNGTIKNHICLTDCFWKSTRYGYRQNPSSIVQCLITNHIFASRSPKVSVPPRGIIAQQHCSEELCYAARKLGVKGTIDPMKTTRSEPLVCYLVHDLDMAVYFTDSFEDE